MTAAPTTGDAVALVVVRRHDHRVQRLEPGPSTSSAPPSRRPPRPRASRAPPAPRTRPPGARERGRGPPGRLAGARDGRPPGRGRRGPGRGADRGRTGPRRRGPRVQPLPAGLGDRGRQRGRRDRVAPLALARARHRRLPRGRATQRRGGRSHHRARDPPARLRRRLRPARWVDPADRAPRGAGSGLDHRAPRSARPHAPPCRAASSSTSGRRGRASPPISRRRRRSHAAGPAERAGVLVGLGGDIATAGRPPDGGWRILVAEDSSTSPTRRAKSWPSTVARSPPRPPRFAAGTPSTASRSTTSSTRGPGCPPTRRGAPRRWSRDVRGGERRLHGGDRAR